jgi:hypothetical protein
MPLYRGEQRISKLYRGAMPIARAYRGAVNVFGAEPEAAEPIYSIIHAGGHTSGTDTITIAGLDFGAAHAARRIVVVLAYQSNVGNNRSLDSVVANGVSLTQRAAAIGGSTQMDAYVWDGIVAAGTSGLSAVLTWSGTGVGAIVGVYRTIARSYQASGTDSGNVANVSSGAISVGNNGFVVAAANRRASVDSAVWNAGVDQDAKAEAIQSNLSGIAGSRAYETGGSVTVSTSDGASGQQRRLLVASYQPD